MGFAGCLCSGLPALEIELRYDLDTSGFFNDPVRRAALRAVADVYEALITDELGRINPADFPLQPGEPPRAWSPTYAEPNNANASTRIPGADNMIVPANTLIIYAGGRDLTSAGSGGPGGFEGVSAQFAPYGWVNQIANRGEPGAVRLVDGGGNTLAFTSSPTDIGVWGGAVFFDTVGPTWNFSTTTPAGAGQIDFVAVALHEIAHVLGIGIYLETQPWGTIGIQGGGTYKAPLGLASANATQIFFDAQGFHWNQSTPNNRAIGIFGRVHGSTQKPIMVPTLVAGSGLFTVLTDLDVAALQDIGWEVAAFPPGKAPEVAVGGPAPQVRIPGLTGFSYQVSRSTDLVSFSPSGAAVAGTGNVSTWTDPVGPASAAFYRVEPSAPTAAAAASASAAVKSTKVKPGAVLMIPPALPPALPNCRVQVSSE